MHAKQGVILDAQVSRLEASEQLRIPVTPTPVGPMNGLASDAWGPNATSLHHKWKLWHEMSSNQQDEAYQEVLQYINKYGKLLRKNAKRKRFWKGNIQHGDCEIKDFGGHKLCLPAPDPSTCVFLSFGINDNYSFDSMIATEWGCRGFAGDPTVQLPSHLHPKVTFHNLGATTLFANDEREKNKGGAEAWWTTSMPSLRKFLSLPKIDILKLDCEGCEVAFARDILAEDPNFLRRVDQISIETHMTRIWIKSKEHLYYFGLQFPLLEEAGFVLEWTSIFGCSKVHEWAGCIEEIISTDFPCGYFNATSIQGKRFPFGVSCQDFLWRRHGS
jgi:hypothetical protein